MKHCLMITALFGVLLLFHVTVQCADYPAEAETLLEESPISWEAFLSATPEDLIQWVTKPLRDELRQVAEWGVSCTAYLLLAGVAVILLPKQGTEQLVEAVSAMGFTVLCGEVIQKLFLQIGQAAADWHTTLCGFIPIMAGVLTAEGRASSACVFNGLFLGCSALLSGGINTVFLPFLNLYLCLFVVTIFDPSPGLSDASGMLLCLLNWLLKGIAAAVGALLSLQGVMAGNSDTATLRAGKAAVNLFVPVVGDVAVQAAASAAAGMKLLRGLLGFAAISTIAVSFFPLLCRTVLLFLFFGSLSILAKGIGLSGCGAVAEQITHAVRFGLSILVIYFFLVFLAVLILMLMGVGG